MPVFSYKHLCWNARKMMRESGKCNLTITIDGLKNQRGQICLNLFSNSEGFPTSGDRALQSASMKITDTVPTITFQNLPAGKYAVAVIHDANCDGKLNCNFLGIPTEGFGFSRNPKIRIGSPEFAEAAIVVEGANTHIQIQMRYLLGN
ncbi:DUF2141 domain-containing protein [Fischerella thermalis]|nr:DUF2141 domain-containing protein [Fischerella thermalis]